MPQAPARRSVRCYLCGHRFDVSLRTMSTTCPGCNKAIKVEDLEISSYVPVTELQTCGTVRIARRGRVVAKRIRCGTGVDCEGTIEATIDTDGFVRLGPKATWKGDSLRSRTLRISDGAKLLGSLAVEGGPAALELAAAASAKPSRTTRLLRALRRPKAAETVEVKTARGAAKRAKKAPVKAAPTIRKKKTTTKAAKAKPGKTTKKKR